MGWSLRKKSKVPKQPAEPSLPRPAAIVNTPTAASQPASPPVQEDKAGLISPQALEPVLPQPAEQPIIPTGGPAESPLGSAPPLGLDASENDEITAIWAQVQERVAMLGIKEGKEINSGLEIDDVIANLEASQEKEEESPTAQAVKVAFGRTMGLIKTVGGIVVDGASTVFAPAGQCYNAISFLINAYDGYQGAFDGLAELLEKCSDHLGRLDYYVKGGMDKRLSKLAAQQLLLFVQICDAALSLRYSAAQKIKTGLKIAFLAENSIQGLLGEMAKLGERERGLVSAQAFSLASAAATSAAEGAASNRQVLDTLVQNGEEQKARAENVDKKKALIDVLAFDESSEQWNSSKQSPVESWQIRYNEIRKDVVSGTGEWLLSHPDFRSWISDLSSSPILAIEGADITGKSYLTSSIIKYLRTDVTTEYPNLRHLVSFFLLDHKKAGHGFEDAAKALIWQLANKDEPFMKSAARISQTVGALDPKDIMPRLLLENQDLEHIDAILNLVIDGIGDTLDASMLEFLQQLFKAQNKKIRVFLTGTPRAFEQIRRGGAVCPSIPISRHNHNDVKKFIEARMDKTEALADTDRPGISEQREKICNDLLEAAGGDYYKLDSALHVISTLDYMEDINQVIQGTRDNRSMQLHNEIEMLNRERSPRQIQEMNHIIRWITFALDPVTGKLASSLLYLVTGEVPLRPLAEQIRSKYLLFVLNGKDYVEFRSPKALEAIPNRSELAKVNRDNGQDVHPGEIDIVLHFLDNVCPPALYEKLGLREYLQKKSTQKQDQIQQEDENTGHLQMALDCIRSFSYGYDATLMPLQRYGIDNFVEHLSSVDLAMVDRDQKSQVGESLVRLFTRNEDLDSLLMPRGGMFYRYDRKTFWLQREEMIDPILRWLRDTAVVSRVTSEADRSWVQSVVSDNGVEALFKPAAIRLAYRCLREPSSDEDIKGIYGFVKKYLHIISEKDTMWQTQMARLYKNRRLEQEAMERSELALEMDSHNWRASLCRASLATPQEAIEILQIVIDRQKRDLAWMQDPSHVQDLGDLNYELAGNYWKDEQFDLAIPIYAISMKQAPQHVYRFLRLFMAYSQKGRHAEIVSFLEDISKIENGKHLAELVMSTGDSVLLEFLDLSVREAAIKTKQFRVLDALYEPAIQLGEKTDDREFLCLVRYLYGKGLYCEHNGRQEKAIELWETSLSRYLTSAEADSESSLLNNLIVNLAPLYLQKMLVARVKSDSSTVAEYVSKLSGMLPEGVTALQIDLPPQLWLARYHKLNDDDSKARQTVRSLLQVVIELLSDEDESNDKDAFKKSHSVFISLGDDKNAMTALAMETRESRFRYGDSGWNMSLSCDGDCDHCWNFPSEMWICKHCVNVRLDDGCMTALKEGKLTENFCNPDHEFIQVPNWDKEWLESIPEGVVPWGDQIITLDQWKQEIQKVYLD
ncbi:unnamed protein product [Penicillium salamii]|nr:unnamed protein product [Penicillium salamii]